MIEELNRIKERNKKVEADKAWETSKTRKLIISLMTYFIIVIFLILIEVPNPFLNAVVPATGFLLSTLTLPYFKEFWLNKVYRKISR